MVRKNKKMIESEKQFLWLVGIIVAIILILIFGPVVYHNLFNKFEYGGVQFEKEKIGEIDFYHGRFGIYYQGNYTANYNAYFRTDPRENNIPVNANITLSRNVSVSVNRTVQTCSDMSLAQSALGQFLQAFPFVKKINTGVNDEETAKEYNLTKIDCSNASKSNTVIIIQKSNTPSIDESGVENCYVFNIGECQYLPTVEKFIMSSMAKINGVQI